MTPQLSNPDSPPEEKTVFLIGHPRSGTTWLMWLLAQHPAIASCNHAGFFHALQPFQAWWTTNTRFAKTIHVFSRSDPDQVEAQYSQVKLNEQLNPAAFPNLIRPLAQTVFQAISAAKPGAFVAVEQTPENALFFELIHEILPEAYFLHITRDPRAVAASMRQSLRDWANPNDFPNHPVQIARSWNKYMDLGKKIQAETDRYLAVSYEELRANGAPALDRVFKWLDLESTEARSAGYLEASTIDKMKTQNRMPKGFFRRGQALGWETDLSAREIRSIEYVAAGWMQKLDYKPVFPSTGKPPVQVRWYDYAAGLREIGGGGLRRRARRFMARTPGLNTLLRWAIGLRRTFRGMSE